MTRRHPHVVNADELEQKTFEQSNHRSGSANEEALFVISGSGTARIGDQRVAVRAGDWIAVRRPPTR
jgi:uncharacterized cupin superfamily protein